MSLAGNVGERDGVGALRRGQRLVVCQAFARVTHACQPPSHVAGKRLPLVALCVVRTCLAHGKRRGGRPGGEYHELQPCVVVGVTGGRNPDLACALVGSGPGVCIGLGGVNEPADLVGMARIGTVWHAVGVREGPNRLLGHVDALIA